MIIPEYKIAFKDKSLLMKILGFLLFFNKKFMTNYSTTIGNTVYFPTETWLMSRPVTAKIILYHELIHMRDSARLSRFIFSFAYLFPQILAIFSIPLFFYNWIVALVWLVFFLMPIPAYFRMALEKKAYTFSLYTVYRLNKNANLDEQISMYSSQFNTSYYYYMWPFNGIDAYFQDALVRFKNGEKPFYPKADYDMIDYMIDNDIKF